MKKLILIPLLILSLAGCATTMNSTSSTPTTTQQTQGAASSTLYATGALLKATPGICDTLYNAGKITKEQYNSVAAIYNQALASFNLAVSALQKAIDAGQDPAGNAAYAAALSSFVLDANNLQNLVIALGGAK